VKNNVVTNIGVIRQHTLGSTALVTSQTLVSGYNAGEFLDRTLKVVTSQSPVFMVTM